MAKEPQQLSLELPNYLTRWIPIWANPGWQEANRWRAIVHQQPVAGLSQNNLIRDLQGTQFEVRAKETKEQDSLADDIEHYTHVLNPEFPGALSGFDIWLDYGLKDLLGLPVGFNTEVVRYPDGHGPLSRPYADPDHPTKGGRSHVAWLAYMDGATLTVTYDRELPLMQSLPENTTHRVFFRRDQIARTVLDTRNEMRRWGYGMPPPERVYLALEMLVRSDTYYANLLLDTPEAGILDLGDMKKESAQQWLTSFRELLTGIDPFKIPVLYETTRAPSYIAFTRPPTEMMLDAQTLKYAQIMTAAYGLTISDIGLGDPAKTLAGSIRDERKSRRSGYGTLKEKIKNLINNEILPDYLEFAWIENDTETKIQNSRAFNLSSQALERAKKLGAVNSKEAQAQLVAEGHITVEVEEPEEPEPMPVPPQLPPDDNGNQQIENEVNRVPESEGGRGDTTGQTAQKSEVSLGELNEFIELAETSLDTRLGSIFEQAFTGLTGRATRPRLMKLIKAATRRMLPDIQQAFTELSQAELTHYWLDERLKLWFGEESAFSEFPDVVRAAEEVLDALEDALNGEDWWKITPDVDAIVLILKGAFERGAIGAAEEIQEFLYTEGLVDSPQLAGLSFSLKNPRTLAELESKATQLVTRVNDGTKFYLKRIITAGVDEGLSSPEIARMIRDGAGVESVLREAGFVESVIERAKSEIEGMSQGRTESITNTEIARAEGEGRIGQWRRQGLTKKRWVHTGPADICPVCQSNVSLGEVDIDYMFADVFSGAIAPPAHPNKCHCHVEFSEAELLEKAGELNTWDGS